MEANEKGRIVGYDLIRFISIFMVVIIHSNVCYLAQSRGTGSWVVVMAITSCCLVSVPLFFMISGALLLDRPSNDPFQGSVKRFLKQFIPFIIWSSAYVFARILMGKIPLSMYSFLALLKTPAYYQFWFMYSLLAIYMLLPVLQILVQKLNKKQIQYILVIWIIFSVIQPTLAHSFDVFKISEHIDLILCEGYVGYFILGFYLKKYYKNNSAKTSAMIASLGFIFIVSGAIIEYGISKENYVGYYYQNYLTPGVVFCVVGLFLFFQRMVCNENRMITKLITALSSLSIGVYYIHMLYVTMLEKIGFSGETSVAVLVLKILAVFIMSLCSSWVISKIPYLRGILLGITEGKNDH